MSLIDLEQLAERESEQVEWKENVADVDDVVEAVCAFANDLANLGGGYVVCGAREAQDEHGFPRMARTGLTAARLREVEGRVLARCRDRVSPPLTPLVAEQPADTADKRVLVFTQPATGAAHTFRRANDGAKHYVRVGRSTLEARNGVLLNLLVRKNAVEPWDRRVCSGATEKDLDLLVLRDTLNQMGVSLPQERIERFLAEDSPLSPFVPPLCVREPLTNTLRPRNFAMLLFGRHVQRFVPGAISLLSVYPGTDRSDAQAERHELAGTLIEQVRRLRSLLDRQVYTAFDKLDPMAPNVVKYPQRALYEAMGNALAHRDYELVDPVRVTVFADRVEFLSPGSLPVGVDADAFERGDAPPKWRNQTLAWFFNRLQLAQAEGQGIPTILRTMREEGCPPPVFRASAQNVVCVLPAHPRHMLLRDVQDGTSALVRGDLAAARAHISRAVAQDPLDLNVLHLFAALQRETKDPTPVRDLVQSHLGQLLKLPSDTLMDLAEALLSLHDNERSCRTLAIQLIRRATDRSPSVSQLHRAQALLLEAKDGNEFLALIDNEQRHLTDRTERVSALWFGGQQLLAHTRRLVSLRQQDEAAFVHNLSNNLLTRALAEATSPDIAGAIRADLTSLQALDVSTAK